MTFWEKVKLISSNIWEWIQPVVKLFLSKAGQVLAQSALSAVTAVATNMSGSDAAAKRDAAFKIILDDLKKQGVSLGTSAINMAIEIAVQKLKEAEPVK